MQATATYTETTVGFPNQSWDILVTEERHDLSVTLNNMTLIDLRMIYSQLSYLTPKAPVANQRKKADWKIAIRAMMNRIRYSHDDKQQENR